MVEVIGNVSKKEQITIPKKLREKYGIKDKALLVKQDGKGLLLKPFPTPSDE